MTETASQTTTLSGEDAIRKLGSSGKPYSLQMLRSDGEETIGEICIKGPHVTKGYIGTQILLTHQVERMASYGRYRLSR